MSWFEIVEQELIQWLQNYEGERFHAILADPPYALISVTKRFGKEDSAPAQEGADGRFSRLSGGFMGAKWDSFSSLEHYREWVKTWAKLLIEKALYPGAVCLFFGGTRTFYHLAVGLEQGGFEIYDTLMFLYGAGFPKSLDISKAIDKAAGEERKVTRTTASGGFKRLMVTNLEAGFRPDDYYPDGNKFTSDEPITKEAKTWRGYGTSLKPSFEPILLCRVPRKGATFASLALEHGSGSLNIDGGRIAHSEPIKPMKAQDGGNKIYGQSGRHEPTTELKIGGRWPANLLLSHHEDCQKIGTFEVPARVINRWLDGMKPFGDGAGGEYETIHPTRQGESSADKTYEYEGGTNFAMKLGPRRDKDMEIVERWACVPECPIRQLDDQVGELDIVGGPKRTHSPPNIFGGGAPSIIYHDSGGPSRFFYCGKASRREKDKGLENFYWKRTGKGFERVDQETWAKLERRERARGCIHPTVKPLDICRYLATLILPPQQDDRTRRILIPFSGSGSEIIAAKQAGWDLIVGIEMNSLYNDIARARIRATIGMF